MRKYLIMGPQGCGKGTQAKMLQQDLNLAHISVGDIFRWHLQNYTKVAARIRRIIAIGALVPDDIVEEVVKSRLALHDWNFGFILDGFPRNRTQAEFFLENYDIDAVILINVPDEVVLERLQSRRLCGSCGLDYNFVHHQPAVANTCDACGGRLVARPDDTPEAVRERLRDYRTKTEPVLELFRRKELVVVVNGGHPVLHVQQEIRRQLRMPAYVAAP